MRRHLPALLTSVALLAAPAAAAGSSLSLPGPYVTNGTVAAAVLDPQGHVYIGGSFDRVGPRYGGLLSLSTASNTPASGIADVNAPVDAAVSDGAGGVFIGGEFSAVDSVPRSRLAHVRADGTLDPDWNPGANNAVRALALDGNSLFVGGDFTQLGGQSRARLGKVAAGGTGALDPTFSAGAPQVRALAVIGSNLYVGTSPSPFLVLAGCFIVAEALANPETTKVAKAIAAETRGIRAQSE